MMQTQNVHNHSEFSPAARSIPRDQTCSGYSFHRSILLWLLGNTKDAKGFGQLYSRGQSISSLLSSHAVQPSHCQDMGIHCIFPLRQANCPGLQRCSGTQQMSHCVVKLMSSEGKSAEVCTTSQDVKVSDVVGMEADADENSWMSATAEAEIVIVTVEWPPTLVYYHPHLFRSTNSLIFD